MSFLPAHSYPVCMSLPPHSTWCLQLQDLQWASTVVCTAVLGTGLAHCFSWWRNKCFALLDCFPDGLIPWTSLQGGHLNFHTDKTVGQYTTVGQEELQGLSGRGGGNGNMKFVCCHTCCNFKPQPLAVFSWVTATRKAKTLTAYSPFASVPFHASHSSLLALLLSYWPSSLLQQNLSSNFCMSWFNSLTQQRTIWTLHSKFVFFSSDFCQMSCCGRNQCVSNTNIFILYFCL